MIDFIKSNEINKSIQINAMGGVKTPHRVSLPVLRNIEDSYVIAAFVFLFNAEQLKKGEINRPLYWILADILDGEIYEKFNCKTIDFSKEPFDKLYYIKEPSKIQLNEDFYNRLFSKLDTVRSGLIQDQYLDKKTYDEYMTDILETLPQSYRVFYKELSNI